MTRKEKLKYMMYMALFHPLSWLPLWILYRLSDIMYIFTYRCFKYRLPDVRQNLLLCFPDMTDEERRNVERKFYHQFCDNFVETIKLLCISDRQMRRRLTVIGAELIEEIASRNHPIILFLGHCCNWEWVPAITLYYNNPTESAQIYLPLHDKAFDRVMLKVRSRFGSTSIDKYVALRHLLRLKQKAGTFLCGFLSDSRTEHQQPKQTVTFLRRNTPYYPGGEIIGNRIGAEYLYIDVSKVKRGHYRYEFKKIIPDDDGREFPVTRKYLQMLEETIDRAPAYWLWSHRRWI